MLTKKRKKATVQLTTLLDLLFIMVFISLMQTKDVPIREVKAESQPVAKTETQVEEPKEMFVTAIFHFFATASNPSIPTGTYAMQGKFNRDSGLLQLGGVSWINRPTGYDMIPLNGIISESGRSFTGRVDFPGCEQFTLRRTSRIDNTHVSGKWEGSYRCSQGETGLTLTIQ